MSGWRARPVLAGAVESAVVLAPFVLAGTAAWFVGRELPMMAFAFRVGLLAVVAIAVAITVERVARQVLPLTVLLRMAMVFPDRTPSRFAVAREAGHPRELQRRVTSPDAKEADAATAILSLVGALTCHDRQTRGHSERVRAYTDLLSTQLGLEQGDRDRLRWAGLLHDIGKLEVSASLLNKAGKPTATEWEELKRHPDHGAVLAAPLLPWLGEWGEAIAHHHERFDGTGYPRGLAGEQISLGGRIVALVDSFETMTASRSYKKAISHRAAREELTRCAGTQFDPALVRAFLQISLPRLIWAMGPVAALVQLPFLNTIRVTGSKVLTAGGSAASTLATPALVAGTAAAVMVPAIITAPTGHHHGSSRVATSQLSSQHADPSGADTTLTGFWKPVAPTAVSQSSSHPFVAARGAGRAHQLPTQKAKRKAAHRKPHVCIRRHTQHPLTVRRTDAPLSRRTSTPSTLASTRRRPPTDSLRIAGGDGTEAGSGHGPGNGVPPTTGIPSTAGIDTTGRITHGEGKPQARRIASSTLY
jgi:hypothetical protein